MNGPLFNFAKVFKWIIILNYRLKDILKGKEVIFSNSTGLAPVFEWTPTRTATIVFLIVFVLFALGTYSNFIY